MSCHPDLLLSSTQAAAELGMSRQGLTTPRMDAVLRPIRRGVRRFYSPAAIDAYKAQRDARRGVDPVVADYYPLAAVEEL